MKGGSVEIRGRLLAPHNCCLCEFTEEHVVTGVLVASGYVSQRAELDEERGEGGSWKAPAALDLPLIASDW